MGGLCPHVLAVRHAMFARPGDASFDEDKQIPPEYRGKRVRNTPNDVRVAKPRKRGRDADTEENEDDEDDDELGRPRKSRGGKYGGEKPKRTGSQRGRLERSTPAQRGRLRRLQNNQGWVPSEDEEEREDAEEDEDVEENEEEDEDEELEEEEKEAPPKKKEEPPKKKAKVELTKKGKGGAPARMTWKQLLDTGLYHTRVECPGCKEPIAVVLRSDYAAAKESKSYVGECERSFWKCCNCDRVVDRRSSSSDRTKMFETTFTWAQYLAKLDAQCEPDCLLRMEYMVENQLKVFKEITDRQRQYDAKKVRANWRMYVHQTRCFSTKKDVTPAKTM